MTMVKNLIETEIFNRIIKKRIDHKRIAFRRPKTTESRNDKVVVRRMIVMITPIIIYYRPTKIRIIIFNKVDLAAGR
jgi:hypothetical protein